MNVQPEGLRTTPSSAPRMHSKPFGATGRDVAAIGQGTWRIHSRKAALEALTAGLDLGLTHVDTAELYEWGSGGETMLGEVLSAPGPGGAPWRESVTLASKVHPRHARARDVVSACKDSLVRLQTDRIDLYYHHWREDDVPLEETLRALAGLVDAGWVRAIGVSNYDVADLEEATSVLGAGRIAANQVLHHLADRGAEREVVPWCRQHGVTVVGYSPFGSGRFVGGAKLRVLEEVGQESGATPRQVALAFLTREDHVVTIPKAERAEHARENAGGSLRLAQDQVARLDGAFPVRDGLRTV